MADSSSLARRSPEAQRVVSEMRPEMAKAVLRKTESEDSLKEIGECLDYAKREAGWNLEELAAHMPAPKDSEKRDPRQVQRWIDGKERVQMEVVFAVPELRAPFVIALAALAEGFEEEVTLRYRKRRQG